MLVAVLPRVCVAKHFPCLGESAENFDFIYWAFIGRADNADVARNNTALTD